jgi:hypothetical protein
MTRIIDTPKLVSEVVAALPTQSFRSRWSEGDLAPQSAQPPRFAMIVGAGFSAGVVPMAWELLHATIGNYYYLGDGGPAIDEYPLIDPANPSVRGDARANAAGFWAEYNEGAARAGLTGVELGTNGLPINLGAAYQALFEGEAIDELFKERSVRAGRRFLLGMLQYLLLPGSERGQGFVGRTRLNQAHAKLGEILGAQQTSGKWTRPPFCRTVFTTNFDTLLQQALHKPDIRYLISDRPQRGLDPGDFPEAEEAIHLVYVHGSILRYNPANSTREIKQLAANNRDVIAGYLQRRDVLVVGHSGWRDTLTEALWQCVPVDHHVYWCDLGAKPPSAVEPLLAHYGEHATYVALGPGGADALMTELAEKLVPT